MWIRVNASAEAAADDGATFLARRIGSAIRRRGVAHVAVSGGRTPALMFAALADRKVDWSALHLWQVDERVAPAGDPDRNLALLSALPVLSANVHPLPVNAQDLVAAAAEFGPGLPRFDVVHLGLGDDGHTASWPPGDPVVEDRSPIGISGEYRGRVRLTLTPSAVNGARARLVVVTGADKAAAVERWLFQDVDLPIDRVRRTDTVVVLDADAAAGLPDLSGLPSESRQPPVG
jgi:6-phosphogluconolactonase